MSLLCSPCCQHAANILPANCDFPAFLLHSRLITVFFEFHQLLGGDITILLKISAHMINLLSRGRSCAKKLKVPNGKALLETLCAKAQSPQPTFKKPTFLETAARSSKSSARSGVRPRSKAHSKAQEAVYATILKMIWRQ